MAYKVCKFGGTSVATREQIERVIEIIKSDEERKFVVVSAPGKHSNYEKMTDALIGITKDSDVNTRTNKIKDRIKEIGSDIPETVSELIAELDNRLSEKSASDHREKILAFGEYSLARLVTEIMKKKSISAQFYDPRELNFTAVLKNGVAQPNPACYQEIGKVLVGAGERNGNQIKVIPGFYAYIQNGDVITLPRGGSDTTGAVISNAINASVYENWTDTNGLYRVDPGIVASAELIKEITYAEARELAYMGFKLQMDAMVPLLSKRIPIHVRNTMHPGVIGTLVVSERVVPKEEYIAGVASREGFISLDIAKMFMNQEIGFGSGLFSVFEEEVISYEHAPTGIDDISIIVEKKELEQPGKIGRLIRKINERLGPLEANVGGSMALVVVAGLGMKNHYDTSSRVLHALGEAKIHDLMLNKGASEISFFIGVDELRAKEAVRAIYNEFYGTK